MRLALFNTKDNTVSVYENKTLVAMLVAPIEYKITPEEIEEARVAVYKEKA